MKPLYIFGLDGALALNEHRKHMPELEVFCVLVPKCWFIAGAAISFARRPWRGCQNTRAL